MKKCPLARLHSFPLGQRLGVQGHGHVGFAHYHKEDALEVHLPQILSIQIAPIDDDSADVSSRSQIVLRPTGCATRLFS